MYMKNKVLNFNVSTVNNEYYIRKESVTQPIYFRTQQLSDKTKECERLILKFYNCADGRVIFMCGTGTLGMEALIDNLISNNDKTLVINGGTFGKRWINLCNIHNIDVFNYESGFGKDVDLTELEKIIIDIKPKFLLMQHVETSSGQLYDIKLIGNICKKYDIKLILDSMTGFLIHETLMDKWNIYASVTSSHKGLCLYPGLSIVVLSKDAFKTTFHCKNMYNNFLYYLNEYNALYFPYTTNIVVLNQMYIKLKKIDKIGVKNYTKKIEKLSIYFRSKIKNLPLKLAAETPSICCSVLYTEKTDIMSFFDKMCKKNIYFTPTGGKNGKIFSVGHLGDLTKCDYNVFIKELKNWLI